MLGQVTPLTVLGKAGRHPPRSQPESRIQKYQSTKVQNSVPNPVPNSKYRMADELACQVRSPSWFCPTNSPRDRTASCRLHLGSAVLREFRETFPHIQNVPSIHMSSSSEALDSEPNARKYGSLNHSSPIPFRSPRFLFSVTPTPSPFLPLASLNLRVHH